MEKRIEEPDKIINPDIGERVYLNIIKKRGRCKYCISYINSG
ncbi:hypothetical protein [Abyssisolibacter fermentans]|nr:hypothetical protein [Abyssisolibacter fermentans]